ncbi:MAG: glycosyl hydrolase [Pirellulaceae bacterium]
MKRACPIALILLTQALVSAGTLSAQTVGAPPVDRLFHKPGLIYLWALNDECSEEKIDHFVAAFAAGGASAVCLHPRPGLLKPYGGDAWFEFIRRTVDRCAERGLDVWLYDEDPYPSGNAGGRMTLERPELQAMEIKQFEPTPASEAKGLYCFPAGTLLWCGLVNEATRVTTDLTSRVGLVRRKWITLDPWDSRYYYPATPRYKCPRAWTIEPEYGVEVAEIPADCRLLAFVAQSVASDAWANEPDRLNPEATQAFLALTHERYAAALGDRIGNQVRAIFTDEPKYASSRPWTRAMFPEFKAEFGYELPPRLWMLFSQTMDTDSVLTRLHFRQWCGERFRNAWLMPVGRWCREHHLALVGHISPEDDIVQQNDCVSNLLLLHSEFALPGLDLIIPAVGDHNHPLINVGVLGASSAAQQLDKPGVMSESLACSGLDFTAEQAAGILQWQLVMGVTTPVVHCAYNSIEGLRLTDAPPDFGPASDRWPGMTALGRELAALQPLVRDATQIAPVAMLWPIRSFAALPPADFTADSPLRNELVKLIQACLDHQVGLHLIDEGDLCRAKLDGRQLKLGKATYSHVLIPTCTVLHERTVAALRAAANAGVAVLQAGDSPRWQQTESGLEPLDVGWCTALPPAETVQSLPRLTHVTPDGTDIRCTMWERNHQSVRLIISLREQVADVTIDGQHVTLQPNAILVQQ